MPALSEAEGLTADGFRRYNADGETMSDDSVMVNRAPVLTLWGAVVAKRLGYDEDAALTLGKAMAGLNAQSKGRRLGIFGPPKAAEGKEPKKRGLGEEFWIELCGRNVPAKNTDGGVRAVVKDKAIDPAAVEKYLRSKFGEAFDAVRSALTKLAAAFEPDDLAAEAYGLYERFRPEIPAGRQGWGAKGELDLKLVESLAGK